jgi:hypothetical protein
LRHPHEGEHDRESQVGNGWRISKRFPGDEDEYACHEEDGTKATEEVVDGLAEPSRRRRGRLIGSNILEYLQDSDAGETGASRA